MTWRSTAMLAAVLGTNLLMADSPSASISNGQVRVRMYLPDAAQGFYRATRFDWSGVISSLQYNGHEFYGPWFDSTDPTVHDFVYRNESIVAGPCSSTMGPVDSFEPLGWEDAPAGGTFVKVGVGILKKPADAAKDSQYDAFRLYEIADPGKWTVQTKRDLADFRQTVSDAASGYGFDYRKIVRLASGKPELILEHSLKNTGRKEIRINVYNHNFLSLDRRPPGPGLSVTFPFTVQAKSSPLVNLQATRLNYSQEFSAKDTYYSTVDGFGSDAKDNFFQVEDRRVGAGVSARGDRPLSKLAIWSIRSVISVEPFILVAVQPGKEFTWTSTYIYSTVSK